MNTNQPSRRRLSCLGVLILLTAVGPGGAQAPAGDDIVLGMSTVLTGPAADLGISMRQGVLAGLERMNRAGGLGGRKLRLVALDDGYEPGRAAPNMRRLLDKENVLAIIGNVGTPTAIAAIPIANESKTLFFAAFTGAGVLRKTVPDRYVFNYRASYAEETQAMIDALIEKAHLRPSEIAFFTQRDGYGDAGFVGGMTALKRHGLKDEGAIIHARFERNTEAVETGLAEILSTEKPPRAIIMVGTYLPCAKFIRLAREADLEALFLNVSFVGSASLAQELGPTDAKVIVTQVVPYPEDRSIGVVSEYLDDLHELDKSAPPRFGSLEGYIASRIFCLALERAQGPLTRESIVDAMEKLGEFQIGLGEKLFLSPEDHQACHKVWPTVLRGGKLVPFDWEEVKTLVHQDG